ncbi:MAG: hypothetical protein S0880_04615 [Actinomycetota bacterium]|nr:hypothetical protein [Actinomycetota bacterium]
MSDTGDQHTGTDAPAAAAGSARSSVTEAASNVTAPIGDRAVNAAGAAIGGDWPSEVTDRIVGVIGTVRSKTTGPAITISRAIVYGLLAAVLAIAALILLVILLVRIVDVYLPGDVWAAHLLLGAVFLVIGLFLWSKRR